MPKSASRNGVSMPFGRHKGRPLAEVPSEYLRWSLANVRLGSGFRREIVADLGRRSLQEAKAAPDVGEPMPTAEPRTVMGWRLN
jgi:hypothetical protein